MIDPKTRTVERAKFPHHMAGSAAAVIDPTKEARLPWLSGGGGQLFADLTWTNRPDMTGSEAPECLQDAWVATMLAIRALVGRVPEGSCFLVNLTAYPLVQRALGEGAA